MYLKWILATAITAVVITGCGGDNDPIDPVNSIDMADYTVASNTNRNYDLITRDGTNSRIFIYEITNVDGNKVITEKLSEDMILSTTTVKEQKIKMAINPGGGGDDEVSEENRFVDIGDTVMYFDLTDDGKTRECKVKEELNGVTFTDDTTGPGTEGYNYTGDILKLECEYKGGAMFDTYQVYLKKGEGLIAEVNHSCQHEGVVNDSNIEECTEAETVYRHRFYSPAI